MLEVIYQIDAKSGLSPAIFVYACKSIMLISISDVMLQHVMFV